MMGPEGSGRTRPLVSVTVKEASKETRETVSIPTSSNRRQRPPPSRLFVRRVPVAFRRVLHTSRPTMVSTVARSRLLKVGSPIVNLTPR
jgi:hypothetical protein